MLTIQEIKPDNILEIKQIYEDFRAKAIADYHYQAMPIEFDNFCENINDNRLGGLVLYENAKPEGILIYSQEKFNVVEINAIHSNNRKALAEGLINMFNKRIGWDVISYPMLGVQESLVKDIALSGFKFVGQSIMKFDFHDPVSYRILKMEQNTDMRGNSLSAWDEKYKAQAVELIHLAFKNNKMTNFDPRFLTIDGANDVLDMILTNQYGIFLPNQSRILINDGNLEGFCFAVAAADDKINIPLIALKKNDRNNGLGKLLLKSVISGFAGLLVDKKIKLKEINATADTDNYPAIKMYRRLGFREEYFYAHAYYKNSEA